jgi:hypothetical protein
VSGDAPKHAKFGGSKAKIWLSCPGAARLWEQAPLDLPSSFALEGTAAHALGEYCLRHNIPDAHVVVNSPETHRVEYGPFNAATADAVNHYLRYVATIMALDPCAEMWIEAKVAPVAELATEVYGSVDCGILLPSLKRLVVLDYKHGAGVAVDPTDNEQCKVYAAGLMALASASYPENHIEHVDIVIVQPRVFGSDPVKVWTTTASEIREFQTTIRLAVAEAKKPDAELVPGDHCRWCQARGICPAYAAKSVEGIPSGVVVTVEDVLSDLDTKKLPAIEALDIETVGRILKAAPAIEAWIKGLRDYAFTVAARGGDVPGFKLVEKDARRKWACDDLRVSEWLTLCYGLDEDLVRPRKLATITEVERLLKSELDKAQFKEASDLLTLTYTVKESSGLTLVPESDRRPSATQADMSAVLAGIDDV